MKNHKHKKWLLILTPTLNAEPITIKTRVWKDAKMVYLRLKHKQAFYEIELKDWADDTIYKYTQATAAE